DPNIEFWKELKDGSDHCEVAKTELAVLVCGKHYVFGATANGAVSPSAPCPSLNRDGEIETAVAEKAAKGRRQGRRACGFRREADSDGLRGRRPKPGLRRLQGHERPGRARSGAGGDRSERFSQACP